MIHKKNIKMKLANARSALKFKLSVSDRRVLPPSHIVSHSKNLEESNFSKFDQIYIIK